MRTAVGSAGAVAIADIWHAAIRALASGIVVAALGACANPVPRSGTDRPGAAAEQATPLGVQIEHGAFILHKFAHANGRETYSIRRDGEQLETTVDFSFTDRGHKVALAAGLRTTADLSPLAFELKGEVARGFSIDQSLALADGVFHLRDRDVQTDLARPAEPAFAIAGYAPIAFQMLLVRYWSAHGKAESLRTLPAGSVRIHALGRDQFRLGTESRELDRFEVEGLVWGRETLWLDAQGSLVAAVTTDAEMDKFEAVREDYEAELGEFIHRAGTSTIASLGALLTRAGSAAAADVALVGGTVIDATGRPALDDGVVLLHDGVITAVGPRAAVVVPAGFVVVDVRGKWVLPGLWDMHAHFEQAEWGPIYLAAGATTVRDCGNEFEFITAARDAIARHDGIGPRLLLAGIVDGTGERTLGAVTVDNEDQARQWTRRYHDAGFQQMKIYSSVSLENVRAVAREAHRLGMTVTGHVPDGLTAYQAVDAGMDQINHIDYIAEMMMPVVPDHAKRKERLDALLAIDPASEAGRRAIAFLKDHGVVVDPTIALYEYFTATTAKPPSSFEPGAAKVAPELRGALTDVAPPDEETPRKEAGLRRQIELIGALHRAGIPIVAGTDQTIPGWSLHREMELYVEAGFTSMEAIQAATLVPARAMGLESQSGTLEPGKRADVIVVGGDPLADIHNLRRVEQVITGGRIYQSANLWRSVGFTP